MPRVALALLALGALACSPTRMATEPARDPAHGTEPAPPTRVAAAADTPPAASAGRSPGCGKHAPRGGTVHVQVGGRDRTYTLVVPEGYAPARPYPLVFVLHGGGGSAAAARTQTDLEHVAASRAIFVYPQGVGGTWDLDSPAATNPDVALFDAILLASHNALCLDSRRVFVTGFSNGAYMANQLACRRGDRIRAIVTHAGGGPYEVAGTYDAQGHLVCSGKAVAALVVHGTADATVAPSEGQKSVEHWSFANRCSSSTRTTTPPCEAFVGCVQPVSVCRVPGLGHGLWKDAGRVTWAFFDALR
jgi:polyhydroxybutyrate depolymerase